MKRVHSRFRMTLSRVKWRLTLSYLVVTLLAIFILAWWLLVAGVIYLQKVNPGLSWVEVIQYHLLPALLVILPSITILAIPATLVSAYFGFLNARWLDQRLEHLIQSTRAWQRGNFSVRISDDVRDEIGDFGQEMNEMASQLERLVSIRADLAAVEERHQIARDLHDSVKQQITAASFQIAAARAMLEQGRTDTARASLHEAENLVQAAHQELSAVIFELRPLVLKAGNMAEGLRGYLQGWSRQNHIEAGLRIEGEIDLPAIVQNELTRFVQEALSNVARHSHATRLEITLLNLNNELQLSIRDNGCGFQTEGISRRGFGLQTMRERVVQLGGRFSLESIPGQGTLVAARLPLSPARENHG